MIYLDLFMGFLRVGLFAFGGAYGAIPLIREVVLAYGWLTDSELSYMIAVSESTPGPIMINLATYVGSSRAGFLGSVLATSAVVLPSFIIIILIAKMMKTFIQNKYVKAALLGLNPCIIGIVFATGIFMAANNIFPENTVILPDYKTIGLTVFLIGLIFASKKFIGKKISPVLLIIISAFAGIILYR